MVYEADLERIVGNWSRYNRQCPYHDSDFLFKCFL